MDMRYVLAAILATVLLSGCNRAPPTMAGGRPVSYWVDALHAPEAKLRRQAAFKLGNVGPADDSALPALKKALKDTDARVRCEAILALLKFGAGAQEAVPDLTDLRQHDLSAKVRGYAAKALDKMQRDRTAQ